MRQQLFSTKISETFQTKHGNDIDLYDQVQPKLNRTCKYFFLYFSRLHNRLNDATRVCPNNGDEFIAALSFAPI
jgi:hypothetical protein